MTTKICAFCHPDPSCILEETKDVLVMVSNPRLMKGHLLIIPKRHVERPWELDENESHELFTRIHHFQKKLSQSFGTGCDLRQNYRPFIKEGELKVDHLHFHLLPRTFEDELYEKSMIYEKDIFQPLQPLEADEVKSNLT